MVLIPPTDEWALAVARLPAELAARFPSSLAPLDSLEALIDKGRFATVLKELGVPHPRTVRLGAEDSPDRLPAEAFANAFLKPCNSMAFRRRFGVKGLHFKTPAEAMARAADVREAGLEALLQEYVPGPPSHHFMVEGFVDRTGRVCGRFVRQRLRMHPPDFGDSTYMVSVPLDRVRPAVESLDRLLSHLSYRGVFEAEFKYDARDGEFKLLEVNGRPWYFIGFAAMCGVDLCAWRTGMRWGWRSSRSVATSRGATAWWAPTALRAGRSSSGGSSGRGRGCARGWGRGRCSSPGMTRVRASFECCGRPGAG